MMCLTPGSGVVERCVACGRSLAGAAADGARRFRGEGDDCAGDAGNGLDGGFGACAHGFELASPGGVDGNRGEHLAVAQGDPDIASASVSGVFPSGPRNS